MATFESVTRLCVPSDREFLFVNGLVGLVAIVATGLLVHFGSFAGALAAIGLSPAI